MSESLTFGLVFEWDVMNEKKITSKTLDESQIS